jgi:hypothetical protein
MRPIDAEDALLWSRHLETLRAGVRNRSPDGVDRVRREIKRIERELGPLASTLAVMQARERTGHPIDLGRAEAIMARMEKLRAQLDDLRPILRNLKATPLPDDHGPTPEVAARPAMGCDIPEDLLGPAMDLRCGWLVRTSGLSAAISSYDELRTRGEPGRVAEMLERAYTAWHAEMQRQRMLIWPVTLLIFEGRSAIEAARLRGADPRMITHLVAAGLILYQVHAAS